MQITVEVPSEISQRGKRKKFDMEAWLKRQLGRAEREVQLLAHKAHFVLLLAHLKYVNDCLGRNIDASDKTRTLLGLALSIVPPAHMTGELVQDVTDTVLAKILHKEAIFFIHFD